MMISRPIVTTHIRWMIVRDMTRVMDIERAGFADPWDRDEFTERLRQRNCIGMVAETADEKVVGFMVYELHKNRIHLVNFAVDPSYRYQGVGAAMIEKLANKLTTGGRERIMVEVAENNLDAQLFFRRMGFYCYAVLDGFYEDQDAYAFQMIAGAKK